jgi:hypothetical protein
MCNHRTVCKYIHLDGARSCQLVMGVTHLHSGSAWNTMPAHTHMRRSEIYMYFNLPEPARVFHLMGFAEETRHIVMKDREISVCPGWSIHAGVGTQTYSFCWAWGREPGLWRRGPCSDRNTSISRLTNVRRSDETTFNFCSRCSPNSTLRVRPKTKLKFFGQERRLTHLQALAQRRKCLRAVTALGDYGSHAIKLSVQLRAAEPKCMRTMMTCSW